MERKEEKREGGEGGGREEGSRGTPELARHCHAH